MLFAAVLFFRPSKHFIISFDLMDIQKNITKEYTSLFTLSSIWISKNNLISRMIHKILGAIELRSLVSLDCQVVPLMV